MAAPTSIAVTVDDTEYSRYEVGRDTITASVTISGGAPYSADEITVELRKARRSRDAAVATATLSFTASTDPQTDTVTFYLPDLVDQDLISLVRHGKYFVYAEDESGNITGESDDFDIRIITVDKFKESYLFGLPLTATSKKSLKLPVNMTGVTVTEVPQSHPTGVSNLTYSYTENATENATADIGSGANGTVTITADGTDTDGVDGNDWNVEVTVPAGTSPLTVSTSGTTITVALSVSGGSPVGPDNTATLVAAAIDALTDFSATASGTGADSLSAAEDVDFAGGTSDVIRTLAWAGGPAVTISGNGTYILQAGLTGPLARCEGASSDAYICVKIAAALLPTASAVESLFVEQEKIDDDVLARYLDQAIAWVENDFLQVYIEPTNVVTDRDPTTIQYAAGVNAPTPIFTDTDFDFLVSPLTYFVPKTQNWVGIQTPYKQVLRVDSLYGAIANTRVIDIDLEWIEVSQQGGLIQLVPYNQEIAFDFLGLIWVNAIRGAVELPNFWHFNMIVGLRDANPDVRELVAKKAAMEALLSLALAFRPGVGSQSLSRDGVSQSVSYINQQQYGIYTAGITAHKEWLETHGPQLQAKYRGMVWDIV